MNTASKRWGIILGLRWFTDKRPKKTEVVMEKTEQLSLFDEAETEATGVHLEKEIVVEKHTRKAKRTQRLRKTI